MLQDKIFDKYFEIRGANIDNLDDSFEQYRFSQIVSANYQKWLEKDCRILEIGCYKGYTLKELCNITKPNLLFGIDLSQAAVDYARHYTGLENIFCENAFSFLQKHKEFFDAIIMKAVMEHIPKEKVGEMIALIYDSLKPGGVALISVPNMAWVMASHERYMDFTHEVGFTIESLHDVIKIHFKKVRVLPMKYDFPKSFKGKFRKKIITPVVRFLVGKLFNLLGEGAYIKTMFDRSILAVCKKQ